MSDDRHFGEELQDLLDGRLAASARAEIEAHVARCPQCRHELAELERGRAAARSLPALAQPAELAGRIAGVLDGEDRASASRHAPPLMPRRWRFVVAGLIAAAVLIALLLLPSARGSLPAAVARDFASHRDAPLALELRTGDPSSLERFFAEHGIPIHVFDLTMMQYRLMGGRVHGLRGRRSALFAYAGPDAAQVICEMYRGTLAELPDGAEERIHNGITFRIYEVHGVTLVFWQEGAIVCVLASEQNTEKVVQLAYAKAVKV
jgi:anti-sigma factor RsiW